LLVTLKVLNGAYYRGIIVAPVVSWERGIQRPLTLDELLREYEDLDSGDLYRFLQGGLDSTLM
jgi:hypothetical protein